MQDVCKSCRVEGIYKLDNPGKTTRGPIVNYGNFRNAEMLMQLKATQLKLQMLVAKHAEAVKTNTANGEAMDTRAENGNSWDCWTLGLHTRMVGLQASTR